MTSDRRPENYHELLVRQNMEKIEWAAVKAFQQNLAVPVVPLLDPSDSAAREIANCSGLSEQIDRWIADYSARGVFTCLTWHLPGSHACQLLRTRFPEVEEFSPLPERTFYTVAVAGGRLAIGQSVLPCDVP